MQTYPNKKLRQQVIDLKKILLVIMAVLLSSCSGLSSVSETEMAERSSDCMSAAETEKVQLK